MTHLETILEAIKPLSFDEAIQYLKQDENFLNGLEMPDQEINLYLLFAGDFIIYIMYWKKELLFYSDSYKPGMGKEWDSLETTVTALSFITTKKGTVNERFFADYTPRQIEFRDQDNETIISYCNDIMIEEPDSDYYKEGLAFFKPLLIVNTIDE